jgi:hypothetical protein
VAFGKDVRFDQDRLARHALDREAAGIDLGCDALDHEPRRRLADGAAARPCRPPGARRLLRNLVAHHLLRLAGGVDAGPPRVSASARITSDCACTS